MKKQNLTQWQQNFLSKFATATTAINQVDLIDERNRLPKFLTELTHNGTLFFIKAEKHGRTYYAPNPKNGLIFEYFNKANRKVEHLEVKQSNLKPFCETVNLESREMSEPVIKSVTVDKILAESNDKIASKRMMNVYLIESLCPNFALARVAKQPIEERLKFSETMLPLGIMPNFMMEYLDRNFLPF